MEYCIFWWRGFWFQDWEPDRTSIRCTVFTMRTFSCDELSDNIASSIETNDTLIRNNKEMMRLQFQLLISPWIGQSTHTILASISLWIGMLNDNNVGIRWFMSWITVRAEDVRDCMKDLFCSSFCSVWKESEFWSSGNNSAIFEPSYIHLTSLE